MSETNDGEVMTVGGEGEERRGSLALVSLPVEMFQLEVFSLSSVGGRGVSDGGGKGVGQTHPFRGMDKQVRPFPACRWYETVTRQPRGEIGSLPAKRQTCTGTGTSWLR